VPNEPAAPPARRAVVDIGTNSVKLLVGDVTGDVVTPVLEQSRQTRLGRGLYTRHRLLPEPVAATAQAVAAFHALAREHGAGAVRAIATSAAREAANAETLVEAVRAAAGLEVEIITGEQEARWGFAGVMSDPRLRDQAVLLLDVGGGSTEFVLGRGHEVRLRQSHRLGAVRLLEELAPADPPAATDLTRGQRAVAIALETALAPALRPSLAEFGAAAVRLVGTGGTATILAMMALSLTRFDRDAVDGHVLTRDDVAERLAQLWSLPAARRRGIPGLPPERADVILTGVLIYDAVMACFGFDALRVTTRSLRFAALADWLPAGALLEHGDRPAGG
jgi:exopolyphosphatase/guanosine-5'-triphosphate,3'-diphosphate pyrophosphatase